MRLSAARRDLTQLIFLSHVGLSWRKHEDWSYNFILIFPTQPLCFLSRKMFKRGAERIKICQNQKIRPQITAILISGQLLSGDVCVCWNRISYLLWNFDFTSYGHACVCVCVCVHAVGSHLLPAVSVKTLSSTSVWQKPVFCVPGRLESEWSF